MIPEGERDGHLLRVKAAKLAAETVAEQYRRQPDWAERYGPRGREKCVRDVTFHVQFLAASVEWGDPARFVRYVQWAKSVMAAHHIPEPDFLATLRVMRDIAAGLLPAGPAEAARRHLDAALAALPS